MAEKILIVDDDLTVNVLVSKALQKAGYETRTAFTADEALMRAGQDRFDLIITDLKMPKVDGVELIRRFAQRGLADTIPIIVLSGYLDDATCKLASTLGVVDFIRKPFDPGELPLRVKRAIDRGPRAAQSQRWVRPAPAPAGAGAALPPGAAPAPPPRALPVGAPPVGAPPPGFGTPGAARAPGPPPLVLPPEAVGPPAAPRFEAPPAAYAPLGGPFPAPPGAPYPAPAPAPVPVPLPGAPLLLDPSAHATLAHAAAAHPAYGYPPPAPAPAGHGPPASASPEAGAVPCAPAAAAEESSSVLSQRRARDARFSGKLAREIAPPSAERPDCLGTLENIRVPELIRFLHLPRRSGLIELSHAEERGEIILRDGEIVRAAVYVQDREIARALVALRQMFGWQSGRFRIAFCEIAPGPQLPKTTSAILAEAFGGA